MNQHGGDQSPQQGAAKRRKHQQVRTGYEWLGGKYGAMVSAPIGTQGYQSVFASAGRNRQRSAQ